MQTVLDTKTDTRYVDNHDDNDDDHVKSWDGNLLHNRRIFLLQFDYY